MTSRLKSGRFIGAATSESARRQLMQPVPCWEKLWVVPENAAPGSNLKVLRWVKTDKKQQFSDDEDAADEPLVPLPDEPIQDEDDEEEKDPDDGADSGSVLPPVSRDASEPVTTTAPASVPPEDDREADASSPAKPHPLSISLLPPTGTPPQDDDDDDDGMGGVGVVDGGALDSSLGVVPPPLGAVDQLDAAAAAMEGIDMRQFGPGVEGFDPNAVEDQVMQDALRNGMPGMLGK